MKSLLNYQILEKLGESLYAEVFKVVRLDDLNKVLVLKKIKPQFNSVGLIHYIQQQMSHLVEHHFLH